MTLPASTPFSRIAVLGAGPIGLEAAFEGVRRGFDVALYEAGRVGEHLRSFDGVTLFTPLAMNASDAGRARLRELDVSIPDEGALVTAGELVSRYLEPLSRLPELTGRVHERSPVIAVAREGLTKSAAVGAVGDRSRARRSFLLHIDPATGHARYERADIVIDATGVYGQPRATGPGGLHALGEHALGARIDRHIVPIRGGARARYSGRRVLLIGNGHSVATALLEFEALNREGAGASVTWVRRSGSTPFHVLPDDPLQERVALGEGANRLAREAAWLTSLPGATIERYEMGDAVRVSIRDESGVVRTIEVDQILALVGYRPDNAIHRELQIHLCYASEGPMALANALLAAAAASPDAAGDCLKQTAHGAETLRTPEPGYFLVGSKSYGRNPQFLLSLGHRQIADVFSLIEADRAAAGEPTAAPASR